MIIFADRQCASKPSLATTLVLDTNVVLDWLVFREPSTAVLADALTTGRMCWIATGAMLDELEHVLDRGRLDRWQPDRTLIRDCWSALASRCAAPAHGPHPRLICTDVDDQKFIDLALCERADFLLTRDRDLLRLAGRARSRGLAIMSPASWLRLHTAPGELPLVPQWKKGGPRAAFVA